MPIGFDLEMSQFGVPDSLLLGVDPMQGGQGLPAAGGGLTGGDFDAEILEYMQGFSPVSEQNRLDRAAESERQRKAKFAEYLQGEEARAVEAMRQRVESMPGGGNWLTRGAAVGALQAGSDVLSLGANLIGRDDIAQQQHRFSQTLQQGASAANEEAIVGKRFADAFSGAVRSMVSMSAAGATGGGAPAMIGLAAATEANQAEIEAEEAGMKGWQKWNYVLQKGGNEAAWATAFQMVGLGGAEAVLAGQTFKGTLGQIAKQVAKQTGAELLEENLTELGHLALDKLHGLDQRKWHEGVVDTVIDTTLQTAMMMGLANATQAPAIKAALSEARQNERAIRAEAKPENAAADAAIEDRSSRKFPETTGLELPSLDARQTFVEGLRAFRDRARLGLQQIEQSEEVKSAIDRPSTDQPTASGPTASGQATPQAAEHEDGVGSPAGPSEADAAARQAMIYLAAAVSDRPLVDLEAMSHEELQAEIERGKPKGPQETAVGVTPSVPETSPAAQALAFDDEAVAQRLAWRQQTPPDIETPHGQRTQAELNEARWRAIQRTYVTARAAEQAVPGVPLKDVFGIAVFSSSNPYDKDRQLLDYAFAARRDYKAVADQMWRHWKTSHPNANVAISPGVEPYRPRLGEPSYKAWKAGATFSPSEDRGSSKAPVDAFPTRTPTTAATPRADVSSNSDRSPPAAADPLAALDALTDDEMADMFGAQSVGAAVGTTNAGEQDSSKLPPVPEKHEPFPTAKSSPPGRQPEEGSATESLSKPTSALPTVKGQRAAAQDQARQDFQNSLEELKQALRNMGETGFSGVPLSRDFAIAAAHVARSTVRLAIIEGKAKAAQFADFVREVADAIGMEATRRYGQNLRDVWDGLRARMGDVMSESVDVESLSEKSLVAKRPATLAPTRAADSEFNAKLLDAQPTMKAQADAAWRRYPAIRHLKSPEDLLQDAVAWMLDNKDKYDPARASFKTWASRAVGWTAGKLNEKMIGRGEAYAESPVEPLSRDLTPAEEAIFAEDKQRVTFGGRRKISSKKTGGALVDPLDTLEAIADDELAAMFGAERTRSAVADTAVVDTAVLDTAVVEQRTARQRDARKAVADSLEEVRQAASKIQLTLFEGLPISRELAVAISRLARDTVRLAMVEGGVKVAQFSDFVKQVAEAIGADLTRKYGQNLRDGWDQLRGRLGGGVMSESVAVEGLFPAKSAKGKPTEIGERPKKQRGVLESLAERAREAGRRELGYRPNNDEHRALAAAIYSELKKELDIGQADASEAARDIFEGTETLDSLRSKYPPIAASPASAAPEPAEPATPRQPADILRAAGLTVNAVTLGDGRTVWRVSGNIQPHEPLLRELGGSFYGRANAWTFWNEDPTRAIASRLDRRGDGSQLGDGQARAADVERERYRRRESERPDGRGSGEEFREFVGADTQALIARGSRFGIPQHVTDGQIEDIGAVTRAFVNDKPVFVLGSAPGMGKTFVLGGVIRELRKRNANRFVYVTENQELIRQVQANLADYGLDGVEFVTYAGVRREAPNTLDAVLLLDEAHNAKNLNTTTGNRVLGLVRDAKFTVYSTATPFENVSEAKYMEASGLFDGITAEVERRDSKGRRYAATIEGFDAWAWIYGAELFWPKGEDRPDVYWPKRHAATDAHIAANEWLAARGVYAMRPMVLPPGTVTSELRSVQADQAFVDLYGQVVDAYAAAEAGLGEGEGRLKGKIRAHGINLQKRILEAAKAQEGIRRAKELVADGKQVVMFVNTKADRDIGRYKLSEPYRKHHKIKGKAAEQTYTPAKMREMMDRYDQAKAMARRMRDDVGPPPFAREVYIVAMAMEAAGIDTTLPSVVDDIMAAFPADQVVEYTGRLSDTQAKRQLDEWKQGKRQVIVATMDKGGTGLSYHDTTGAMPERVQLNINLPWSGTQVEQVAGRLARLGTAKPVALEWIFADNIEFERELSRTVGGRMRSMQAVVQGVKSETARKIRDFDIDESPAAPGVVALDDMGETGNNAVVTLADGTSREVQYIAVEDDVIIPSHDARRNFARNERGAKNIQRPYDNPVEGRSAREQVLGIAKADPKKLPLLVSDTPSAIDGPPVATIDSDKLIVRGGNARSQGVQLGYFNGGEEAERFKQAMVDAAEKFGIDPNKVAEMERPIIVRVIQSNANEDMTRLEQLLNDPMTAGMSAASVSASQAASLSQESVDQIAAMLEPKGEGDPPTVRELLANGKIASKIVGILVNDKAWGQREVDRFTAGDDVGELNDAGKLAIEELLIGRIVANPIVAGKMTPGVRRTLLASLGPLTRLTTHPKYGERFSEILRTAIEAFPGYKNAGSKTTLLDYFLGQKSFGDFEVPGQGDKSVAAVVDALDRMGMRRFKNVVEDILESLGIKTRQKGLFESDIKQTTDVDAAIAATVDSPAVREKKRLRVKPRAMLGGRKITTAVVQEVFPGAEVTRSEDGWDVRLASGTFSIRWTGGIELTEEAKRRLERETSPEVRNAMAAAGSFSLTLPDGTEYDGLGLIELVDGLADDATLRHEALHLARALGLITDREWQSLVDEYAPDAVDEVDQEERVAEALETWADPTGIWERFVSWVRRLLAKIGVRRPDVRDIRRAMRKTGFWQRKPTAGARASDAKYQLRAAAELMEASGESYADADEFAKAFRAAVRKVSPLVKGFTRTGAISQTGLRAAVQEAISDVLPWLESNAAQREYYANQVEEERQQVSRIFPELGENDDAWLFYKLAGAIASNSTQLSENVQEQIDAWENFRDTGRFGVEVLRGDRNLARLGRTEFVLHGGAQAVKAQHYQGLNQLMERLGSVGAVVKHLLDTIPAAALRALPKEIGQGELNGKQVRQIKDTVKAATGQESRIPRVFVFGPKIGAYALNNLGRHEYTTVDVWESRFWRSFFADVPEASGIETDSAARDLFKQASNLMAERLGLSPSAGQAVRWYFMIDVARQAGYTRARSNDTIAGYTRRIVEKRVGAGGGGLEVGRRRKAADARGDRESGEVGAAAGAGGKRTRRELARQAAAKADAVAAEIKQAVRSLGTTASMGVDPKLAAMIGRWATYKIQEGVYTFADFLEAAVAQFGRAIVEDLRPYLQTAWDEHVGDAAGAPADAAVESRAPSSAEPAGESEALAEDSIADEDTPDLSGRESGEPPDVSPITSIKNAVVEELRERRGIGPLDDVPAETRQGWLDAAQRRLSEDPGLPKRLVAELAANPRNLEPVEVAVMQLYYRRLNNAFESAAKSLFAAADLADSGAAAQAQTATDMILQDLLDAEEATKAAGREWGRAGVARQIELLQDFSLGNLLRRGRVANGGKALKTEQNAQIEALAKRVRELEQRLAEREDREREQRVDTAIENARTDVEAEPDAEADVSSPAPSVTPPVNSPATPSKPDADAAEKPRRPKSEKRRQAEQHLADAWVDFKGKFKAMFGMGAVHDAAAEAKRQAELLASGVELVKAYVQLGVVTFSEFMARARKELGGEIEEARPLFAQAWEQVKAEGGIPKLEISPEDVDDVSRLARKLMRAVVESGITERDAVVDAVHQELRELLPDITRRETMDAMSGYGQFTPLSREAVEQQLRQLRGELQQIAKLEDMAAGHAPLATGRERPKPGDEWRRLIQMVNEAKKRGGFIVTDPARQLRTALDAAKTAVRHRIADLELEIRTGEKIVRERTPLRADRELEALRAQRDALLEEHRQMFPPKRQTEEQKIAAAGRALDRAIAQLEQDLATGNLGPRAKAKRLTSPELDAKRARLEALRAQRDELRALANPKMSAEERAVLAYKRSLRKRLADYQARIAAKDFAKRERRQRVLDQETLDLKYQLEQEKLKFTAMEEAWRRKQRHPVQKVLGVVPDALNASRAILTSADFSAVLRQGGFTAVSHPIMAAHALPAMFKAFVATKRGEFAAAESLRQRPNAQLYQQAKLAITTSEGRLSKQEEAYMGRWTKYIPLVRASERAYVTFLNRIRADLFDSLVATLGRNGGVTVDEARVIANFVNVSTGRGPLGRAEAAAGALATVFFSPRFVASRFQLLAGQPMWKGNARTRKLIAREYGRALIGLGTLYGVAMLLGMLWDDDDEDKPTVSFDPLSSDFGKIRFGNTRVDPLAGLSQTTVFSSRMGEALYQGGRSLAGFELDKAAKRSMRNSGQVVWRFLTNKASPWIGNTLDFLSGETFEGERLTPWKLTKGMVVPISLSDILDSMEEQGIPGGTALSLLAIFGMGVQTYQAQEGEPLTAEQIQAYQDLVRGKGAPDEQREAKTPYGERLEAFKTRQDRAVEILRESGQHVPVRNSKTRAQFGGRRKGLTFSFR